MNNLSFVKPTGPEWIDLIRSELASGRLEDALWWQSPEGWRVRAFYQREDTPKDLLPVISRPGGSPWDMRRPVLWSGEWPKPQEETSLAVALPGERGDFDERRLIARSERAGRADLRLVPGSRFVDMLGGLSETGAAALLSVEFDPSRYLDPHEITVARRSFLTARERHDRRIRWFYCDAVTGSGSPAAGPATALAYAFASASSWISAGREAGVPLPDLASGLLIALPAHRSYFATVASFRAARIGVARLFEAWGGSAAEASVVPVHGLVSTASMEAEDGDVNLIRATVQLAAAVVGGCDAVQIDAPPGDRFWRTERLYANLHHLLRDEGHLHEVADPSAGAWYVEQLTRLIGETAWAAFAQVEARFDDLRPAARAAAVERAVLDSAQEDRS